MIGVKDKIWFLREGLFAKYVISLVGLVVFVLAVNGAIETWISYRATRTTLTDGMSDKAEATAKRIEQSISELERQISWVTRASSQKLEDHHTDYAQLLNQVPAVSQLSLLAGNGRELLRLSRTQIAVGSQADFSRDVRFTETVTRGVNGTTPALHANNAVIDKVTNNTVANVTMNPGTYIMAGGGFWVCGSASLSANRTRCATTSAARSGPITTRWERPTWDRMPLRARL